MDLRKALIAAVLLLALIVVLYYSCKRQEGSQPVATIPPTSQQRPCPDQTLNLVMEETVMDGLLKKGQKYRVYTNWYACHPLKNGDLVYYRYSTSFDPVVRVLRAIPGDKFAVLRDKKVGAWNLSVNGDLVMSGADPYYFGGARTATLSLYENSNKGQIAEGDAIVLSNVAPGANDSGLFGVANVADILGKVEPVSE